MKKVLIVHYSQTGQLTDIVESIAAPLRALLFDAWFANHSRRFDTVGDVTFKKVDTVLCAVRVVDGTIRRGDVVTLMHSPDSKEYKVHEVGIMHPEATSTDVLYAGMVGYVDLGMTTKREASTGDTICDPKKRKDTLPAATFKPQRPVIFAGFYPNEGESFDRMASAIERLCINDPSVTTAAIRCEAFGPGLQLGFFGTLHLSVFQDRLSAEHNLDVLVTPSQVFYQYLDSKGLPHALTVDKWTVEEDIVTLQEPVVTATIVCRDADYSEINSETIAYFRGEPVDVQTLDGNRVSVQYRIPLSELIRGLMTRVMRISKGYASLEYDEPVYQTADLVKVDVMVNKRMIPALSTITIKQDSMAVARRLCMALKENLDCTIVNLPIQALVGGKILARETVSARKKDVLAKIHAGDYSRKAKKLDAQKEGKARIAKRMLGQFSIDSETLATVMGATKI